jgi:ketosteroid isomerase-like protein
MSEENVEIVQRVFELWNSGELDEVMLHYDPDVVVKAPEGWPEGQETRGVDAWRQRAQRLLETWDEARSEVDEIQAAGTDRVLVRMRYVTRATTGLSFATQLNAVFRLKERKITELLYFWELEPALEAAGLSE